MDDTLRPLVAAWVAAVGAVLGSFLNVVIARVPEGLSIVRPGSRCPRCGHAIAWWDNVPVVSWLVLRGRCRRCGAPISFRYVAIELLGAGAALVAWQRHGLGARAAVELAFVLFLLALATIDVERWELPHELTRPLIALGLAASAASLSAAPGFTSSALGAAVGWGAFWLVRVVGSRLAGQEAMGIGDLWLAAGLGAFLGAPALLPVVMLASIQGALVGVALLAVGKGQPGPDPAAPPPQTDADWVPPRHGIPFGVFLGLGAVEWLWLSERLAAIVPALELYR
jgi:leader peptidase (prepilin peptidase)/N-methyltransferase